MTWQKTITRKIQWRSASSQSRFPVFETSKFRGNVSSLTMRTSATVPSRPSTRPSASSILT